MLPPGSLASRVILSYSQEAKQALQATGRTVLPQAQLQEALPIKEAQKRLPEKKALQEGKPKLSENPQALARIKELLTQTPRPSISQIAKEIGYPKGTVAGYTKKMLSSVEL